MKKKLFKSLSVLSLSFIAFASLSGCAERSAPQSISSIDSESSIIPGETLIKLTGDTGVEVGKSTALKTVVYGPNASVDYSSSDTSIATVDSNGVVTGLKPGFVTITAQSVVSTSANPITASFTLFVEPSYVVTMTDAFKAVDYASGTIFDGNLYIVDPSLAMNYSLALQTETGSSSTAGSVKFDFSFFPPQMLSSLIYGLLQPGFSGKSIDLAYLGGSDAYCYAVSSAEDATIGFYKRFNPLSSLASLITPSLISAIAGSKMASGADPESLFASFGQSLNTYLDFSPEAAKGISLKESALALVNSGIASLKTAIATDPNIDSNISMILPQFLPYDISDVRFLVETNTDGSFKDLHLQVTDNKPNDEASSDSSSESATIAYTYFDLTLEKSATALEPNYFLTLEATLEKAEEDSAKIATIEASVSCLQNDLDAYNGSLYDALHLHPSFAKDVAAYNADVYPLLKSIVNTSLVPTMSGSLFTGYKSIQYVFGPYETYTVTRKDDSCQNTVYDNYKAKAGDVFSLSEISIAGGEKKAFTTAPAFNVTLSDAKKTVSDYAALNGTELTIGQLPADADLTLTITPSTVDGCVAVPFNLVLTAGK